MAFYGLNYGEKATKHGEMKSRDLTNRSFIPVKEKPRHVNPAAPMTTSGAIGANVEGGLGPLRVSRPSSSAANASHPLHQQQQFQAQPLHSSSPLLPNIDSAEPVGSSPSISNRPAAAAGNRSTALQTQRAPVAPAPAPTSAAPPKPREVALVLQLPSAKTEKDVFDRLDFNGNGMLSLAELDKACVEIWPRFNNKPAIMRAYKAADANETGFISRKEFRLFLQFLVRFSELWNIFTQIDGNGDRKLSLNEIMLGAQLLGIRSDEAQQLFREMDRNGAGSVLFDEFCGYFAEKEIQAARDALKLGGPKKSRAPKLQNIAFLELPNVKSQRELFDRMDVNRNGMLSLAELDKAVVECWPQFNHKPALMRAYKATDTNKSGFVSKREFEAFLRFIVVYVNLWQQFQFYDTNGDRRVSRQEFVKNAVHFAEFRSLTEAQLHQEFDRIDQNGMGFLLFDEFCEALALEAVKKYLDSLPPPEVLAKRFTLPDHALMCHLCGKFPLTLATHLPKCTEETQHRLQSIPSFLLRKGPTMSLPIPTSSAEVTFYNQTAQTLFQHNNVYECPECRKVFTAATIGAHFKTHNVPYSRKMELMKDPSVRQPKAPIKLPVKQAPVVREDVLLNLKLQVVKPFELSKLSTLRKNLYVAKVRNDTVDANELRTLLLDSGCTVSLEECRALLRGDIGSLGTMMTDLESVGYPSSRAQFVERGFAKIDTENVGSMEYRRLRDALPKSPELLDMFLRPLEKHVSLREFQSVLADLSVLYTTEQFEQMLDFRSGAATGVETCLVRVTFLSGEQKQYTLTAAAGTMRKDKGSLTRRLALLGVRDCQKIEVL